MTATPKNEDTWFDVRDSNANEGTDDEDGMDNSKQIAHHHRMQVPNGFRSAPHKKSSKYFDALLDRLKSAAGDKLLELSVLAQIAAEFSIKNVLPKVYFVGMESQGKTSFLEVLMGYMKIGFQGTGRATVAPVVYSIERIDESESEKPFSITVKWADEKPHTDIPIDDLAQTVEEIMKRIKAEEPHGVSKKFIYINIRTTRPDFHSMVYIDLPGMIANDVDDEGTVQELQDVNRSALREMGKHDLIVAICASGTVPSHFSLFKPPKKGSFSIREFDPQLKNTVLVLTMADTLVKNAQYNASDQSARDNLHAYLNDWRNIHGTTYPFVLSTHHIDQEIKKCVNNDAYTEAAKTKHEEHTELIQTWLNHLGVDGAIRERYELEKFLDFKKNHLLEHFLEARENLVRILTARTADAEKEMATLNSGFLDNLDLKHFLKGFVTHFQTDFDKTFRTSQAKVFKDTVEFTHLVPVRATLQEDLKGIKVWPDTTATNEEEFFKCIKKEADWALGHGHGSVERLLKNFFIRATSVEPEQFTHQEMYERVSQDQSVDVPNNNAAIGALVRDSAKLHFAEEGLHYLCDGIIAVLKRVAVGVMDVIFELRYPQLATEPDVKGKLRQCINHALQRVVENLKTHVADVLDLKLQGASMYSPHLQDTVAELLMPSWNDGHIAKGPDRAKRMEVVAKFFHHNPANDCPPSSPVATWSDAEVAQAQYSYDRQFSVLRQLIAFEINNIFTVALSPKISDKDQAGCLHQFAEDEVINRHITDPLKADAQQANEDLEDFYRLTPAREHMRMRKEQLAIDIDRLQRATDEIDKMTLSNDPPQRGQQQYYEIS